ncbi:hypothetical protein FHW79_002074 [Azospirillum sp. OGB3]|uniref:DUF4357 domain-containing protein n=1 Tax=Azospirillum sp. OGB3 TaxID=2587012 RepID=UPI001605EC13|nr:hypothetical protein [Azospirillum sp. OGB3]
MSDDQPTIALGVLDGQHVAFAMLGGEILFQCTGASEEAARAAVLARLRPAGAVGVRSGALVPATGASGGAPDVADGPVFELRGGAAAARGRSDGNGFIVLAGSTARAHGTDVSRDRPLRDQLLARGVLRPAADPKLLVFAQAWRFSSASQAGGVVLDRNCSGPTAWRIPGTGQTLRDWQKASPGAPPRHEEPR